MPCPGHFTSRKNSVCTEQEAGWVPGLVKAGVANLAPVVSTSIRLGEGILDTALHRAAQGFIARLRRELSWKLMGVITPLDPLDRVFIEEAE